MDWRFSPVALISAVTPEIFQAMASIRWADHRRRKKVAGRQDSNKIKLHCLRMTAEQIAALRKELASHPESYNEHDIMTAADEDVPGGAAPAGQAAPKPGEAGKPAPPKPQGQ